MLWPSSQRGRIGISIAIYLLLVCFAEGVKPQAKDTDLPGAQGVDCSDRPVESPNSSLKNDEEKEKNNPAISDDSINNHPTDKSKGFDKDNPEKTTHEEPVNSSNQFKAKKPLRAEFKEYSNKDEMNDFTEERLLEILENIKSLKEEIHNLKEMQQPAANASKRLNDEDEEVAKDSSPDGKDNDEILDEDLKAQAESSKRKWVPQTPMSKEVESSFWGWIIGISIILIFLAFGATFIAIRTYW
jgi:hypothetical protein